MKISAVTTAYNEEKIISGTLRNLKPFVDRHIVMLSEKPFNGPCDPPDNTEMICLAHDAVVVKGVWPEHSQRNIGTYLCNDCDWILEFDADEMMTTEDLQKLIKVLESCEEDAVAIISKVYWRTTDYIFSPDPDHHKIIAIKPNVKFYKNACVNTKYKIIPRDNQYGITHHHLSYCEPKDIYSKVRHYVHANEFDGEKWYKEHYINWKPGDAVYQPFGTKWEAIYDPLPQELKDLL